MEAATVIQSRLIGAILVEKNLITGEQLERALQLQAETGERLGEIVVAEFGVPRLELASVLAEQWAELEKAEREAAKVVERPVAPVEPLTPAEAQIRRPLGEIFVELGFISSDQLDAALDTQRESGARIGEILVEQGSLTRLDLASALAEQWSALQKLRPPAPVAEPQPWQNGPPSPLPAEQEPSADDRAVVAALDERLRVVERAAAATPWQEDLRLVTSDLRAAVRAVEERLETRAPGAAELESVLSAVNVRIEALENAAVATELAAVRQELDELKTRPVTEEGVADLRAAIERLEGRPDQTDEISRLSAEITGLASRLDGLAAVGELTNKLDAVAGQAEVAQTGIAGLSRRVDDLAGLEKRLDELAARLPGDDVIEELRRALTDLATQAGNDDRSDQGADIASLVARLDQVTARVEDVATARAPDLTPRIDDLSARIDEVAAAIPNVETADLTTRLESLEDQGRAGSGAIERLAAELGDLGTRTEVRLEGLAAFEPDMSPVEELRVRVAELAAAVERGPDSAMLDELRSRLDELAVAVGRGPDPGLLDGLRFRLDELAEAVGRVPDPARWKSFVRVWRSWRLRCSGARIWRRSKSFVCVWPSWRLPSRGVRTRRCWTNCVRGWTSWRLRSGGGLIRDCSMVCGSVWTSWPRRWDECRIRLRWKSFVCVWRSWRLPSGGARTRRCWTNCARGWTSWRLRSGGGLIRHRSTRCVRVWPSWRLRSSGSPIPRRSTKSAGGWRSSQRRSSTMRRSERSRRAWASWSTGSPP